MGKKVEKLGKYLARMEVSMSQFALELGVTREAVRAWCSDEKSPTLLHVAEIHRMTDGSVSASSFYNKKTLKALERLGAVNG